LQGAGGVGGLVKVYDGATAKHCYPGYDGNGNVTLLVDGDSGQVVANYEYGPFGELLRATGLVAKNNPFRFSTKYQDGEIDFLYYGYRYYNPSTGRWVSRDPIEENGIRSILVIKIPKRPQTPSDYVFSYNFAIETYDVLGLWEAQDKPPPSNISTIICQGGKAVPRLSPGDINVNSLCVRGCIRSHERQHAEEANAQNACVGKPDGVAVAASSFAERHASEIKAYERELECLKKMKRFAEAPDAKGNYPPNCTCRLGNVDAYISDREKRLEDWKKSDPDDPKTWPPDV
jgi:RHS repeat-associated protein